MYQSFKNKEERKYLKRTPKSESFKISIKPTKETEIYGTIERGDIRDLLFIKNKSLKNLNKKEISIFTSSPRRKYNSNEVFPKLLPF